MPADVSPEQAAEGVGGGAAGAEAAGVAGKVASLADDLATLWRHPVYTVSVVGTAVYTGQPPAPLQQCRSCRNSCRCIMSLCGMPVATSSP